MPHQVTHRCLEEAEPFVQQHREQGPCLCSCSGWSDAAADGTEGCRGGSAAPCPAWAFLLSHLGSSGGEQQPCGMPFLLDALHCELGHCPAAEGGGRREGTPGLQISIKGLVRGLWGHLLVLFSLFTPVLVLGVLIKSVINVKIFYRPIKAPKQK